MSWTPQDQQSLLPLLWHQNDEAAQLTRKALDHLGALERFVQHIADSGALNLDGHCDIVKEARKLTGTPGVLGHFVRKGSP